MKLATAICIAVTSLMALMPTPTHASTYPWIEAMNSMKVLNGVWQCDGQIVGGSKVNAKVTIAPANEAAWMRASIVGTRGADGHPWHQELFWIYILGAHRWTMYALTDEGSGEFAGVWWEGSTFTWHGSTTDMASHFRNREIVWSRHGDSKFDWREYDELADGSRILSSAEACTRPVKP